VPGSLTERIAARLRAAVEAKGLTQAEVGAVMGQSQSQVSKYLRGEVPLDLEEFAILCRLVELRAGAVIADAQSRDDADPLV
jgi:transcriptional regulator with XRE-family HTH domain